MASVDAPGNHDNQLATQEPWHPHTTIYLNNKNSDSFNLPILQWATKDNANNEIGTKWKKKLLNHPIKCHYCNPIKW